MTRLRQPSLFSKTRADQIFSAFCEFHREHPEVWRLFVRFTNQAIAAGRSRFSADAVCHRIRWESVVEGGADGVKLNNNFSAYYARMFEAAYPLHAGFFGFRARKSADRPPAEIDQQVFISGPVVPGDEPELMAALKSLVGAA